MAKVKITTVDAPYSGMHVDFVTPCDCSMVDGLLINDVAYTVVNAVGEDVTGVGGTWVSGAIVSVILDCENHKAYIQNPNQSLAQMGITVTPDELNYLDGVTSNVQEQLDGMAATHDHPYLPLSGGTVTGSLILSRTKDIDGVEGTRAALIVGGQPTAGHIEIDSNEIQAMSSETGKGTLNFNLLGGQVVVGSDGLKVNGNFAMDKAAPTFTMTGDTANWGVLRMQYLDDGTNWDIAVKSDDTDGALQFRHSSNRGGNRAYIATDGTFVANRFSNASARLLTHENADAGTVLQLWSKNKTHVYDFYSPDDNNLYIHGFSLDGSVDRFMIWDLCGDGSLIIPGEIRTYGGYYIADRIYPVGSIYLSVNSTSPASFIGGTWTQLKDRFLLGAGSTYSNGATGGAATHTLTEAQLPAHRHYVSEYGGPTSSDPSASQSISRYATGSHSDLPYSFRASTREADVGRSSATGSGSAHNNMPPYLVVYMWKRTA